MIHPAGGGNAIRKIPAAVKHRRRRRSGSPPAAGAKKKKKKKKLKHVWRFCRVRVVSEQHRSQTSCYQTFGSVKKMTKVKKEPADPEEAAAAGGTEKSYQELIANVNPIAQPLASRKLSKKLYKCVKKGKTSFKPRNTPLFHCSGRFG